MALPTAKVKKANVEEAKCVEIAKNVAVVQKSCEEHLALAIPLVEKAEAALDAEEEGPPPSKGHAVSCESDTRPLPRPTSPALRRMPSAEQCGERAGERVTGAQEGGLAQSWTGWRRMQTVRTDTVR